MTSRRDTQYGTMSTKMRLASTFFFRGPEPLHRLDSGTLDKRGGVVNHCAAMDSHDSSDSGPARPRLFRLWYRARAGTRVNRSDRHLGDTHVHGCTHVDRPWHNGIFDWAPSLNREFQTKDRQAQKNPFHLDRNSSCCRYTDTIAEPNTSSPNSRNAHFSLLYRSITSSNPLQRTA